jgi:hypothetical protein
VIIKKKFYIHKFRVLHSRACRARHVIGRPIKWPMKHFCAPARDRPWASLDCISRPRLASGESCLLLPPRAGFGQVMTASLNQRWLRVSHDYISRPELASGELRLHLPHRAGFKRVTTASPAQSWLRVSRDCISRPRLASDETEQHFSSKVGLE